MTREEWKDGWKGGCVARRVDRWVNNNRLKRKTIPWNCPGQRAISKYEGSPKLQGLTLSLQRRRTFTSWYGCLNENVSLNSVAAKASRLI